MLDLTPVCSFVHLFGNQILATFCLCPLIAAISIVRCLNAEQFLEINLHGQQL